VSAGLRVAACLGIGMALWVLFGAVRGAEGWQISGGSYLTGLVVAGALVGLVASAKEPRHLTHAALLVIPGLATLASAGPDAHPDGSWWYLTIAIGLVGAAGTHRLAWEVRRAIVPALVRWRHRRSALAGGPPSR
jgi:hypothetical protein